MRDSELTRSDRNQSRRALRAIAPTHGYSNTIIFLGTLISIPSVLYAWNALASVISHVNTVYSQNLWVGMIWDKPGEFKLFLHIVVALLVVLVSFLVAFLIQMVIFAVTQPSRKQAVERSLEQGRVKDRLN